MSINRAELVARVREALRRSEDVVVGSGGPAMPAVDESIVRLAATDEPMVDLFVQRAVEVGMEVERATMARLAGRIEAWLRERQVRRITLSLTPGLLEVAARSAAGRCGAEIVDWRASPGLEAHFDVDAGITDVQAAIAESGTLVVASDIHHSRGTFLVPPLHLALLRAEQILPDLLDLWPASGRAPRRSMPAATVLISGPSKTADIEGILVTGVHGPREVHILLIAP